MPPPFMLAEFPENVLFRIVIVAPAWIYTPPPEALEFAEKVLFVIVFALVMVRAMWIVKKAEHTAASMLPLMDDRAAGSVAEKKGQVRA